MPVRPAGILPGCVPKRAVSPPLAQTKSLCSNFGGALEDDIGSLVRYQHRARLFKRRLALQGVASYRKRMSEHKMTLSWKRATPDFEYKTYNRDHTWKFDGGHEMEASAAPAYLGNPKNVDPEEAFVAALSSCHMLTFLAAACKKKFMLDEYSDDAIGHMEKNSEGKMAITRVELHPKTKFSGDQQPTPKDLEEMHHFAHDQCFIANSVKTEVTVQH